MTNFRRYLTVGVQIFIIGIAGILVYKNMPAYRSFFTLGSPSHTQTASLLSLQPSYTLNVSTTGAGLVAGEFINCGSSCSASIPYGTSVTLSATPADGYAFSLWGGSCSGASTNCNFEMAANSVVTAVFISTGSTTIATSTASTSPTSGPFSLFSSPYSKTIQWKTTNYPATTSFNFNLIKKISDSPVSYDFIRQLGQNAPNSGSFAWSLQANENDPQLYVEVTCGTDISAEQGCQVDGDPIKVN